MNVLFRNFFYSVGLLMLFFMYGSDPSTVVFADLVRLVQSPIALKSVLVLTAIFIGLEFALSGSVYLPPASKTAVKGAERGASAAASS